MHSRSKDIPAECRPRIILWRLTRSKNIPQYYNKVLSQHECLSIINSIASFSKPIVVLIGENLISRHDLYEIVWCGSALGLKMIVELQPEEITSDVIKQFRVFGPRIFRIIIDERIIEDMDVRYKRSPSFLRLEETVQHLRDEGFEIHLSLSVNQPDVRKLEFNLDYAFRHFANGLYCHLRFHENFSKLTVYDNESELADNFIEKISELKALLPNNMYFSPQCLKFTPFDPEDMIDFNITRTKQLRWVHSCLSGKTFAFISEEGKVFACSSLLKECGDLSIAGYDFQSIWLESEVCKRMREFSRSCSQTRHLLKEHKEIKSYQEETMGENIER